MSYAFKYVANAEITKALAKYDEDSLEYRHEFESNLIYLGTFGLHDPVRAEVREEINTI